METHPPFWWPWGSGSDLGFGTEMKRPEPAKASAFPKQAAWPTEVQEQHLICQKLQAFTSLLYFVLIHVLFISTSLNTFLLEMKMKMNLGSDLSSVIAKSWP